MMNFESVSLQHGDRSLLLDEPGPRAVWPAHSCARSKTGIDAN
jgi:hypothetical protein